MSREINTQALIQLWKAREQETQVTLVNVEVRPGRRIATASVPASAAAELSAISTSNGSQILAEVTRPVEIMQPPSLLDTPSAPELVPLDEDFHEITQSPSLIDTPSVLEPVPLDEGFHAITQSPSLLVTPSVPEPVPFDEGFHEEVEDEGYQEPPDVVALVSEYAWSAGVAGVIDPRTLDPSIIAYGGDAPADSSPVNLRSTILHDLAMRVDGEIGFADEDLPSSPAQQGLGDFSEVKYDNGQTGVSLISEDQDNISNMRNGFPVFSSENMNSATIVIPPNNHIGAAQVVEIFDLPPPQKKGSSAVKRVFARIFPNKRWVMSLAKGPAPMPTPGAQLDANIVSAASTSNPKKVFAKARSWILKSRTAQKPATTTTITSGKKPKKLRRRKARKNADLKPALSIDVGFLNSQQKPSQLCVSPSPEPENSPVPTIFLTSPDGIVLNCDLGGYSPPQVKDPVDASPLQKKPGTTTGH